MCAKIVKALPTGMKEFMASSWPTTTGTALTQKEPRRKQCSIRELPDLRGELGDKTSASEAIIFRIQVNQVIRIRLLAHQYSSQG